MHSKNKADFPDTAFSHSVGAGMKLSLIDWYLPVLMPIIWLIVRLDLWTRLMRLVGVPEIGSPIIGNVEHDEIIAEGTKLIEKAYKSMSSSNKSTTNSDAILKNTHSSLPSTSSITGTSSDYDSSKPSRFMSLDAFSGSSNGAPGGNSSPTSSTDSAGSNAALAPSKVAPSFFASIVPINTNLTSAFTNTFGFGPSTTNSQNTTSNNHMRKTGPIDTDDDDIVDESYIANPWGASSAVPVSNRPSFSPPPGIRNAPAKNIELPPITSPKPISRPPLPGVAVKSGTNNSTLSTFTADPIGTPGKGHLADLLRGKGTPRKF
jgi:hypothetical protein